MPGTPVPLGPFTGGLHNSAGTGEYIDDAELFELTNLEVDTDGSLANRPAIQTLTTPGTVTGAIAVIGSYLPSNGNKYIVVAYAGYTQVALIDTTSLAVVASQAVPSNTVVQFMDNLYVVAKPGSGVNGGYWNPALTWATIASMPKGEDAVVYKTRIFVVAGANSITNTSRLTMSAPLDPTTWNASEFLDVNVGDGQKLTTLTVLADNIILFKQHSTFRYTYATDPSKAELTRISSTIGAPNNFCAVTYDNNNVYVLHDNSVYELFNFTFTKLTANIALVPNTGAGILTAESHTLTLFRSRLFVRYYGDIYVYSLLSGRWSKWTTNKNFSKIVTVPGLDVDTAYCAGVTSATQNNLYTFTDNRLTGIDVYEQFNCFITTKTVDFDAGYAYKVMFWWGVSIATSGDTTGTMTVPNSTANPTWDYQYANYTWDQAKALFQWDSSKSTVVQQVVAMTQGPYARKLIKYPKKVRFRQAFYQVKTQCKPNTVADAAVRIYDITVFVKAKQTVYKQTS